MIDFTDYIPVRFARLRFPDNCCVEDWILQDEKCIGITNGQLYEVYEVLQLIYLPLETNYGLTI